MSSKNRIKIGLQQTSMMKMQKTVFIVSILMMIGTVAAAPIDLTKSGQTPGDAFYVLDRFSESLELAVAKSPLGSSELEAKVRANHAEERLAEARKLTAQNRSEEVEELMNEYSKQTNLSVKSAKKANNTELSRRLGNLSDKHVEVLRDVEKKVPEQAKKGIQTAIENSQKNQRDLGMPEVAKAKGQPQSGSKNLTKPKEVGEKLKLPVAPDIGKKVERSKNKTPETRLNRTQNLSSEPEKQVEETPRDLDETVEDSSEELMEESSKITGKAVGKPSISELP